MRADLPCGRVTFLFTDVEGSTRLLDEVGEAEYARALTEHRRAVREAFGRHGGVEVDTQGDAFFFAFADAVGATAAAVEAQAALAAGPIRVRMGLHTGEPVLTDEGYVGRDVHRGARVAAAGHGGQVLLSAATRDLLGGVELLDLGEHRLKDFAEPVWIFQLGSERFPPLKTISNTNLPRPASSFVGREREVAEIVALLRERRLATLTGPGGSGKTRLAIEAAAELVPEFRNGVFWVGLATVRDPALVLETIAETLGAKDGLAAHLAGREVLLVLDNLEQVVGAAPQLAGLVEQCPELRLLVTSRELLRVRGEVEYQVPPLAAADAVELFRQRSQLEPSDDIAELCRRLDSLPLAVELAAARTSVLSPAQILERLAQRLDLLKGGRDAEARQQTLRATIEWSHELLTEEEQRLFARLAVFRGGCTLEAAEQVADADLDTLQSLVDKSLVRHAEERFWLLETIREFAAERLEGSGEVDELGRRHAEHVLALAEEARTSAGGVFLPVPWLDRIGAEHDNVLAALDRLVGAEADEKGLRLLVAMEPFWRDRAHFTEGRRRLESALRAGGRPSATRAEALNAAAELATLGGDAAAGRRWAEEALALQGSLGDEPGTAKAELSLGFALGSGGDWAGGRPLVASALRRYGELGDDEGTLYAMMMMTLVDAELGAVERGRALGEETVRRARELRNEEIEATTLDLLAKFALDEDRVAAAADYAGRSLRLYHRLGDPHGIAVELRRCAAVLASRGNAATAARLLGAAEAAHEQIGGTQPWIVRIAEEAQAAIDRAGLHGTGFAAAWEEGRSLTAEEAVSLALGSLD